MIVLPIISNYNGNFTSSFTNKVKIILVLLITEVIIMLVLLIIGSFNSNFNSSFIQKVIIIIVY